jgi:hypothetical protein
MYFAFWRLSKHSRPRFVKGRDSNQGVVSEQGDEALRPESTRHDTILLGAVPQQDWLKVAVQPEVAMHNAIFSND